MAKTSPKLAVIEIKYPNYVCMDGIHFSKKKVVLGLYGPFWVTFSDIGLVSHFGIFEVYFWQTLALYSCNFVIFPLKKLLRSCNRPYLSPY